jgi:hypothetical protein
MKKQKKEQGLPALFLFFFIEFFLFKHIVSKEPHRGTIMSKCVFM